MKINKDNFMEATAEAMMKDATQELFKAEPTAFDMFSLFAFLVFDRIDGKDATDEIYADAVASVIVDTLPDNIGGVSMLKELALIIFSQHIWNELVKLDKPDAETDGFKYFKSVLKSKESK